MMIDIDTHVFLPQNYLGKYLERIYVKFNRYKFDKKSWTKLISKYQ